MFHINFIGVGVCNLFIAPYLSYLSFVWIILNSCYTFRYLMYLYNPYQMNIISILDTDTLKSKESDDADPRQTH